MSQLNGIDRVGLPLSIEVPRPALPTLPGAREVGHLVPLALIVAMVCIMQTSAVASPFPSEKGQADNVSRDFAGVGAGSIVAGLIGPFSVDARLVPPSSSSPADIFQIASVTAVVLMIGLFFLAAGLMAYVSPLKSFASTHQTVLPGTRFSSAQ